MITVVFNEPKDAAWKKWRQKCESAQSDLNRARSAGEICEILEALYKEQKEIYHSLDGPFHGKCAYCETLIAANHPGDLDHFRPKNRVTSSASPIKVQDDQGQEVPHPGYYWLTYDWQNLLPACEDCNRPNKGRSGGVRVGKWDEFPVEGFRARNPGEENQEVPLLLNPTNQHLNLENHLAFTSTGVINYLTVNGEKTCEVFGLNLREALVRERLEAYQNASSALLLHLMALGNDNQIGAKVHDMAIRRYEEGVSPYSAAGRAGLEAMRERLRAGAKSLRKPAKRSQNTKSRRSR